MVKKISWSKIFLGQNASLEKFGKKNLVEKISVSKKFFCFKNFWSKEKVMRSWICDGQTKQAKKAGTVTNSAPGGNKKVGRLGDRVTTWNHMSPQQDRR